MNPYKVVEEFERALCDYTGAREAVTCRSCTDALLLCFMLYSQNGCVRVEIPRYTYVGVPQAAMRAGLKPEFVDMQWSGDYRLHPYPIVDSARRFTSDMYNPRELRCVSFHWAKHLPIGEGGAVLLDDPYEAALLRRMRFDGRTAGVAPKDDTFVPGIHSYLMPEMAARGLSLLATMPEHNDDLPNSDYPDLSQQPIFQGES